MTTRLGRGFLGGNDDVNCLKDGVRVQQVSFHQCKDQALTKPQSGLSFSEKSAYLVTTER